MYVDDIYIPLNSGHDGALSAVISVIFVIMALFVISYVVYMER